MKHILHKIVVLVLLAAAAFAISGCQSTTEDAAVPWSRPADWEGRPLGMPTGGF